MLERMRVDSDVRIWKAGVHGASRTVRYGLRFPQDQAEFIADLESRHIALRESPRVINGGIFPTFPVRSGLDNALGFRHITCPGLTPIPGATSTHGQSDSVANHWG